MSNETDVYKIRPAGRHLLTIGRDLIKDKYAAIVELVKNSYDAGSPDVIISFMVLEERNKYQIVVEDHGHGMSRDDVINKWLVPSTDDKLERKTYKNRTLQGRKGIGRWSAAILGDDLFLETVTPSGQGSEVLIQWSEFEKCEFLDQVPILVETKPIKAEQGTRLTITSNLSELEYWTRFVDEDKALTGFDLLEKELSKLVSPFSFSSKNGEISDDFSIIINYGDTLGNECKKGRVEVRPIPIIDAFDYSVSGSIKSCGEGNISYQVQKARNTVKEELTVSLGKKTGCGDLHFDLRVFDRDSESIAELLERSAALKDLGFGKREARNLLNEYNGIGVYRNGFRIRPLGDPEFDWLQLNKRRVQTPSRLIGSDQVIGYIEIQSEELSDLEEKAARDGLKENDAYENLKKIILDVVLPKLEIRRFEFRRNADKGRQKNQIEASISKLNPFDELGYELSNLLNKPDVPPEVASQVSRIIADKGEQQAQVVEEIKKAIAVYQGQATLGKIVNVILHEGRKSVGFFVDMCPLMKKWLDRLEKGEEGAWHKKLEDAVSTAETNAKMLAHFYKQLDPLASIRRGRKSNVSIQRAVNLAYKTLQGELERNQITFHVNSDIDVLVTCWPQDLQIIFTNLFENSIYWICNNPSRDSSEIRVVVDAVGGQLLHIDIFDSGKGIEEKYIYNEIIFEPGFSTKPNGTGLGLAISGEAADRCSLDLMALECDKGSHFRLAVREENETI